MKSVSINPDRLLNDLYELRKFGQYKTGVIRQMYSPADMESRQWLQEQMTSSGLDAQIDGPWQCDRLFQKVCPNLIDGLSH